MRRIPIVAAAAVALTLGACGGQEKQTPEEEVRATLGALREGVRSKDYRRLCEDVFAPQLIRALSEVGVTCPDAMRRAFGDVDGPQLSVDSVTVDGDEATAEVRTSALRQDGSADTVTLVRTEDGWRVSSLGEDD